MQAKQGGAVRERATTLFNKCTYEIFYFQQDKIRYSLNVLI